MDLVSVIIITYKRPIEILERAVSSVLNQSYHSIELIVVNDAPEEINLKQRIEQRLVDFKDDRITYICHKKNMGANEARNTGLKASKGQYIAFLDDDDEWLPTKIEKQVTVLKKDGSIGMVYCGFSIVGAKGDILRKTKIYDDQNKLLKKLLESNFIGSTSFPLLRREMLLKLGGFDIDQVSCQEYELWIRIAESNRIVGIDESLGRYYLSDDSTFKKSYKKYIAGDEHIIYKHLKLFKENKIAFGNHLLNMALNMLIAKQYRYALKYKFWAWKVCPFNINNLLPILFIWRIKNKS